MKRVPLALPLLLIVTCAIASGQNASRPKPGPADFPTMVASLSLTSQTAAVPPTVLFTPTSNGLFRISVDMIVTQAKKKNFGNAYWRGILEWTDAVPEKRIGPMVSLDAPGDHGQGETYTFAAAAGQPVTFSVRGNRHGQSSYDVFLVVEQVGEIANF